MRIIILQQKSNWIDNLKVFGILAVILGHINSPFGSFIFSWHMPLFFLMAGFFIRFDLSYKTFTIEGSKRLLVPYFIFAILGLTLESVKRYFLHRETLDFVSELQGVFFWMDLPSLQNTYAFVLWFLPALFFSRFIFFIANKILKRKLFIAVLVIALFIISFFVNLPFGIDNAFNALLFLFIGHAFFTYYQNSKVLYIFPFLLVGLYFLYGIPVLDMATKNYDNVFINILFALSFIFSLILILKKKSLNSSILKLWSQNTMILFIIHPYTNNIAHLVVEKISLGGNYWYYKLFISLLLLQLMLLLKGRFLNKSIFKYV